MMEALVCHPLGLYTPESFPVPITSDLKSNTTMTRHDQSTHATLPPCTGSRSQETRLPDHWSGDCEEGNSAGFI